MAEESELKRKRKKHRKRLEETTHEDTAPQFNKRIKDNTLEADGVVQSGLGSTVSIAVAASIMNNVQSLELATRLAGQIARAAAIFRIDEIVVFDDGDDSASSFSRTSWSKELGGESGGPFLVRVLQYLEVPQYLRRALIPIHSSLRFVGLLPPLDVPHHLRKHSWLQYREGVVLAKPITDTGSYVDVGLQKEVFVKQKLEQGTRVTVEMGPNRESLLEEGNILNVVPKSQPKQEGLYWGYSVRYARCLSAVFTGSPYNEGYDYAIGTSEHGETIKARDLKLPNFRHLLIAFGGPAGLEESFELEQTRKETKVSNLFDKYLNTCPNQGSRTIRTEEAILISLQYFQETILQAFVQSSSTLRQSEA